MKVLKAHKSELVIKFTICKHNHLLRKVSHHDYILRWEKLQYASMKYSISLLYAKMRYSISLLYASMKYSIR